MVSVDVKHHVYFDTACSLEMFRSKVRTGISMTHRTDTACALCSTPLETVMKSLVLTRNGIKSLADTDNALLA